MISRDIGGLFSLVTQLKGCAPHVVRGLSNRRELAALEVQEAGRKGVLLLLIGAVAGFLFCLAAFSATIVVAAIYWDTPHRVSAISILAGSEVLLAVIGVVWILVSWRRYTFFRNSREQIEKDTECILQILKSPAPTSRDPKS